VQLNYIVIRSILLRILFNPRHVTLSELRDLLGLDGLGPAVNALSLL
jgi:hypothetical protein